MTHGRRFSLKWHDEYFQVWMSQNRDQRQIDAEGDAMEYHCEICDQKIEYDEWEHYDGLCSECYDEECEADAELEDRT